MRTMLLGQFDETRYFRTIIGEDIDKILYSLREKYKENNKDNTVTSSDVNLGDVTMKAVEQYQRLEGSTVEKQVELLSSFTGIKAEKMTEDDKRSLPYLWTEQKKQSQKKILIGDMPEMSGTL